MKTRHNALPRSKRKPFGTAVELLIERRDGPGRRWLQRHRIQKFFHRPAQRPLEKLLAIAPERELGRRLAALGHPTRLSIIKAPSSAASASTFCGRIGVVVSDADSAMRITSAMTRLLRPCGPTSSAAKIAQLWIACARISLGSTGIAKSDWPPIHRFDRGKFEAFNLPRYALAMAILSDRWIREQAQDIGAQFGIWSKTSAGTKVRVAVPGDIAKRTTHFRGPWEGRSEI